MALHDEDTPPDGLHVGDRAPAFRAPTSNGQTLDQDAFVGKLAWAMFFLPAAWTERDQWAPEAEIALAELDELLVEFGHLRVQLLGAARTTPRVARDRHDRDQLAVTLLADEDGTIARRFTTAEPVPASALRAVVVDRTGVVAGVLSAGEATGFPRPRARRVRADRSRSIPKPCNPTCATTNTSISPRHREGHSTAGMAQLRQ